MLEEVWECQEALRTALADRDQARAMASMQFYGHIWENARDQETSDAAIRVIESFSDLAGHIPSDGWTIEDGVPA